MIFTHGGWGGGGGRGTGMLSLSQRSKAVVLSPIGRIYTRYRNNAKGTGFLFYSRYFLSPAMITSYTRSQTECLAFSPVVRIGTPAPSPVTCRRVSPLLVAGWGWVHYTLACGRGGGESQFGQGDRHCGTVAINICTLCSSP
jgi:hypothetical protein